MTRVVRIVIGAVTALAGVALATTGCGKPGTGTAGPPTASASTTASAAPADTPTPTTGAAATMTIKPGLWRGEIDGETVSFQAGAGNTITDLTMSVRTFSDPSRRCPISIPRATVEAPFTIKADDPQQRTGLSMIVTFESDTTVRAEVVGTCHGGLITLGLWFRASWVSA